MTTTQARSPVASLALVRAALRHPSLTDRQRVVMAELASHDPDAFVPTVGVLARTLWGSDDRRHRDHVRKMLRALEERGVLRVEYDDGEGNRDARVLRYHLILGDADSASLQKTLSKPASPSDAGSASPKKSLSRVTPAQRRMTLAQRRSDAGSTGLSTSKNNSKDTKNKKKDSDAQSTSPSEAPKKKLHRKVLKIVRNSDRGMFTIQIASSLGKDSIDLIDELRQMESLGILNNVGNKGATERWKEVG